MHYHLDFSLLQRFNYQSMFIKLLEPDEMALQLLPETAARIEGSLKFCWFISAPCEIIYADEPRATRHREAFLRASLAEYASVEETLQRDLRKLDKNLKAIKITDTNDPLLHLIREMRNLEIHLTSSQLKQSERSVHYIYQDIRHEQQITIWTTNELTEEKFNGLRNARKYREKDVRALVEWFNAAQLDWGIQDLVYQAICRLASTIINGYSLLDKLEKDLII